MGFDFFASGYAGKFNRAFPKCFVNMNNELIVHPGRNSYFRLSGIENEIELKAKVLEWLSREACKAGSRATRKYHLDGINELLGTDFDTNDMEAIYTYLGNSVSRAKTIRFIESGYNLAVLYTNEPEEFTVYYSIEDGNEVQLDMADTEDEAISKCIENPDAREVFAFKQIGDDHELIGCVFVKEEESGDK